jgi:type III pantothenate kinase
VVDGPVFARPEATRRDRPSQARDMPLLDLDAASALNSHRSSMNHTPHYLLIDVSNSFTKIAFASARRVLRPLRLPTARLNRNYLSRLLGQGKVDLVVLSSVVPQKNREITAAARRRRILRINARTNLGIGINYPAPRSIGADRLANAAAVTALFGYPSIVVDFGTAVTFDIMSEHREYIGGVIAPGLESMTTYLYQRTALLPKLSLKEPRGAIGRSTMEAMRVGAIIGYRGLVREIIQRIVRERFARRKVRVVATGGYAALISRNLPEIEVVHPHLTLEGLRIAAVLNS